MSKIILPDKIHHGRNVKRFREMFEIKQEILADLIGLSQQSVSRMEKREKLDDELLSKIALEMQVPVEALKNFRKENFINVIKDSLHKESAESPVFLSKYTFEPLERVVELYERILKEKEKKIAFLEKAMKQNKTLNYSSEYDKTPALRSGFPRLFHLNKLPRPHHSAPAGRQAAKD